MDVGEELGVHYETALLPEKFGEVFFRCAVLGLLVRWGEGARGNECAYAIETTRVDLFMAVGLEGIEDSCAVV